MEVREGYKLTEVGVIPEDWKVKKFREVCTLINGRGFKPYEWRNEGYPIVRIQNLNGSDDFNYYDGYYDKKIEIRKGQLLFAWSGSRGTSFGPHVWNGGLALLNYHTWKVVVKEERIVSDFFLYALRMATKNIEESAHGASALVHVQKWEMEGYPLPIPPTKAEQIAIATALGDTDALIQSLEKLIAKKQAIKQGTMQLLLTGKQRLPGFSGEWEVKKLGEICWYQEGPGLRNWQFTKTGIKVINVTNLENGYLNLYRTTRYISLTEFHKMYEHFEIDEGDIVVASSGNSYGKIAVVRKRDLPLVMNTSVIRFKPLKGLDYKFLLLFLSSNLFKDQIDLLITGGAQPNFGPVHIRKVDVYLPRSVEEQAKVAEVISDINMEIEALEEKLSKYRQIKQGMMQELLTGKTRLV
jgi:type I restriction enzyme S subunit